MVREPDAATQPTPQDNQLMSKHRVLSFKPCLRLEWRGQDGQSEAEQPDHPASLGDSITASHSDEVFGTHSGHTINLHQFARDGVALLGRLAGVEGSIIRLKSDLHDNLAAADRAEAEFVKAVDAHVAALGLPAPEETPPVLRDGFDQKILTELDLNAAGITNVIRATGYIFDFSLVKVPVTDADGFPVQTRRVTAFPGLFFVGLPWLHTAKSGLIYGLAEDARYIADHIAERRDAAEDGNATTPVPPQEPKRSRASTKWADRVMTLIWSSALSLMLDGFAGYAAASYPPSPHEPPQQTDSAIAPADATPRQR